MACAASAAAQELEADFALVDEVTVGGVTFDYLPGAFWPYRVRAHGWADILPDVALPRLIPIDGTVTSSKALAADAPAFIDMGGGARFYVREPNRSWVGKIDGGGAPGNPSPTAYMTWDEKKAYYKAQNNACKERCDVANGAWMAACPSLILAGNIGKVGAVICGTVSYTAVQWCRSACPSPEPLLEPPEPVYVLATYEGDSGIFGTSAGQVCAASAAARGLSPSWCGEPAPYVGEVLWPPSPAGDGSCAMDSASGACDQRGNITVICLGMPGVFPVWVGGVAYCKP